MNKFRVGDRVHYDVEVHGKRVEGTITHIAGVVEDDTVDMWGVSMRGYELPPTRCAVRWDGIDGSMVTSCKDLSLVPVGNPRHETEATLVRFKAISGLLSLNSVIVLSEALHAATNAMLDAGWFVYDVSRDPAIALMAARLAELTGTPIEPRRWLALHEAYKNLNKD